MHSIFLRYFRMYLHKGVKIMYQNGVLIIKTGYSQKYLSYGRNIGNLCISEKVIEQTSARTYDGRISSVGGAPSGEHMKFSQNGEIENRKTIYFGEILG